jgi:hypothetical protein
VSAAWVRAEVTGPCPTPRKFRHANETNALKHLASLEADGNGNPDLNVYLCDCGFWHLGHSIVKFEKRLRHALYHRR